MATSIETHESDHYVDFDEYIDFQLHKTQSNVKMTDVLTALAGVATLVVAYLLGFVIFDHWVVPGGFSISARAVMLGVLVVLTVAWTVWKVLIPYRKRVSGLFAAKLIEKSEPNLKSSLLNLVDLERAGQPISDEVRDAIERRAAVTLTHVDVDHAVDRRLLIRLMYTLFFVVILACLYTLFSPKKISSSIWRAFMPAADVPVPTRTEIRNVRPGDTEVIARTQLEVTVDLLGEIPEQVTLEYTTADRRFLNEPIEMRMVDDTQKRYRGQITGENGRGILQDMSYRVQAGDATTSDYQIRVIQPPTATVETVRLEFPSYMELEPRTQAGGHIDAWEGARVTVEATSNMPVKSARLLFSDTEEAATKAEELRMTINDGTRLSASWTLQFRSDGTHPHFYRIECKNEKGEADPQPTLYSLRIRPDLPPEVALLDPVRDLELPANAVVPLAIEASDPDFRLRYINLVVEKEGQQLGAGREIFEGLRQEFRSVYEWDLKSYGLEAGDVLTYWIEARDNKLPVGNRKNTGKLRIQVLDRVSEEEAEERLEAEKRRQQERLEEDSDEPESDQQDSGPDPKKDQPQGDQPQDDAAAEKSGDEQQTGEEPSGSEAEQGREQAGQSDGEDSQSDQRGPGQQRRLDPDEPADDPEVLRKLMERQQQENGEPSQQQEGGRQEDSQGERESENERELRDSDDAARPRPDGRKPDQQRDDEQPQPDRSGKPPASPDGKNPQPPQDGGSQQQEKDGSRKDKQSDGAGNASDPGRDTPESTKPGEADDPGEPAADSDEPSSPKPPADGQKQPADESPNALQRKAEGDEQGEARPDHDPNADPTQSQNELERKDGEEPARRPRQDTQKQNDTPGSPRAGDQPDAAKPAANQGKKRQQNPDQRPSATKDDRDQRPRDKEDREQQPGNEELKGKGKPEGQKNEQPMGGEAGNSRQSDQGNQGSQQPGQGDTDQESGDEGTPAKDQQKPRVQDQENGQQQGEVSQQQPGGREGSSPPSGNGGDGRAPAEGEQSDQGAAGESTGEQSGGKQATPSDESGSNQAGQGAGDKAGNMGGGGSPSSSMPHGSGGSAAHAPAEEQPNIEDLKQATNLVLKQLENDIERDGVDRELLEELGWTQDEVRRFAERLRKQLEQSEDDQTPEAEVQRRQLEETLRSLDLKSKGSRRSGENMRKRATREISGRRIPVPAEYREAFEAFSRSLAKEAGKSD